MAEWESIIFSASLSGQIPSRGKTTPSAAGLSEPPYPCCILRGSPLLKASSLFYSSWQLRETAIFPQLSAASTAQLPTSRPAAEGDVRQVRLCCGCSALHVYFPSQGGAVCPLPPSMKPPMSRKHVAQLFSSSRCFIQKTFLPFSWWCHFHFFVYHPSVMEVNHICVISSLHFRHKYCTFTVLYVRHV